MKIWTSEHIFEHAWDTVVQAAWKKYPNPCSKQVKAVDVLDRQVDDKGVLKTHRLMTTQWGFPKWAIKLLGHDDLAFGSEHSEVDPAKKTMTLKARNITFCNVVTVDETLVYSPHPEDSTKTHLKQEAVVKVKGVPLSSYIENILTENINNNANKGREGLEWVINKIKTEAETFQTEAAAFTKDTMHNMETLIQQNKKNMESVLQQNKKNMESMINQNTSL